MRRISLPEINLPKINSVCSSIAIFNSDPPTAVGSGDGVGVTVLVAVGIGVDVIWCVGVEVKIAVSVGTGWVTDVQDTNINPKTRTAIRFLIFIVS